MTKGPSAFLHLPSAFALLAACAGCAMTGGLFGERTEYFAEGNYLTYEHSFTDAGAEAARRSAAEQCGYRKKVAVRTTGACTLKTCTTHYQCMDKADAPAFRPDERKQ